MPSGRTPCTGLATYGRVEELGPEGPQVQQGPGGRHGDALGKVEAVVVKPTLRGGGQGLPAAKDGLRDAVYRLVQGREDVEEPPHERVAKVVVKPVGDGAQAVAELIGVDHCRGGGEGRQPRVPEDLHAPCSSSSVNSSAPQSTTSRRPNVAMMAANAFSKSFPTYHAPFSNGQRPLHVRQPNICHVHAPKANGHTVCRAQSKYNCHVHVL